VNDAHDRYTDGQSHGRNKQDLFYETEQFFFQTALLAPGSFLGHP
jgi:hypothetical protein